MSDKGISDKESERKVTFEDMNLQVGSRLQLTTYGGKKVSYYSALIGYEEDKYLFVKMPQEDGFDVPLKVSERISVRFFSGVSIFTFPSCVEFIYHNRRTFLELTFPDNIHMTPLRRNIRIPLSMPISIWYLGAEELEERSIVTAVDLSISGAMLQGKNVLGELEEEIGVAFSIKNVVTEENVLIECMATIRNCRTEKTPAGEIIYKYGVLFNELTRTHLVVLQNYIYETILEGRQATQL